jgi:hypothetical protein
MTPSFDVSDETRIAEDLQRIDMWKKTEFRATSLTESSLFQSALYHSYNYQKSNKLMWNSNRNDLHIKS